MSAELVLRDAGARGGWGAAAAPLPAEPDTLQVVGLTASRRYGASAAARGPARLCPARPLRVPLSLCPSTSLPISVHTGTYPPFVLCHSLPTCCSSLFSVTVPNPSPLAPPLLSRAAAGVVAALNRHGARRSTTVNIFRKLQVLSYPPSLPPSLPFNVYILISFFPSLCPPLILFNDKELFMDELS
jgi:hypothetical protein